MRALSRTDRGVLSPEERVKLARCRARWEARCASTERADRDDTEQGIKRSYAAAGFAAPRIVWCDGPDQLAQLRGDRFYMREAGALVNLVERVRSAVDPSATGLLRREKVAAIGQALGQFPVGRTVIEAMSDVVPWYWGGQAASRFGRVANRLRSYHAPAWARAPLVHFGFGQHAGARLALYDFLLENYELKSQLGPLEGLVAIARSCGWVMPHQDVCFAVERHSVLKIDAVIGKLHGAAGPAIAYPDGWSRYFWKGIAVPGRIIEAPEAITLRRIDAEPDPVTRHCMIDILSAEKFIGMGAATKVASDETGTLWRRSWGVMGAWAAVEVRNGSPEPDGSFRHYFLTVPPTVRSARQGVAWTYGLAEHEYRHLQLRT